MAVVGIFEPDLDETIENSTGDHRGVLNGSVRRANIEGRRISGADGLSRQSTAGDTRNVLRTRQRGQ